MNTSTGKKLQPVIGCSQQGAQADGKVEPMSASRPNLSHWGSSAWLPKAVVADMP